MTTSPSAQDIATVQLDLFRRSPMRQVILSEFLRLIRSVHADECLEIGAEGGAFTSLLRKSGGHWRTLLTHPAAVEATRVLVPDGVDGFTPPTLPFEDKSLDLIVLVDLVHLVSDYNPLITECHRVIKTGGCIALNIPYEGGWSPLHPLRRQLNRRHTTPSVGLENHAFSEEALFGMLKMGFDVIETRSYARFFSELVQIFLHSAIQSIPDNDDNRMARRLRLNRKAYPFFRLAFQLDYLLYPFRGNHLVALARRHTWRPRNSPVLKDADSITGAVLSTVR